MGTVREISVSAAHTINLGGYSNSIRIEASVTVTVNEGEAWEEAKQAAHHVLRELLHENFNNQKDERRIYR